MKTMKYIPLALLSLVMATSGHAEFTLGNYNLNAAVRLGAQLTNGAERQSAKFNEYRDARDSVLAGVDLGAESGGYHLFFNADRIGLKDQSYTLSGGHYEAFKYNVFYNSIVHNYSVNALTFHDGVGTGSLTIPAPFATAATLTNPANWTNAFDYQTTTKIYGVDASYSSASPYIFSLGFNQVKVGGTKVKGSSSITSTLGVEFPELEDNKTNTFNAGVGYKGEDWLVHVDGMLSKFSNVAPYMTFADPFTNTGNGLTINNAQKYWLAPDSTYAKVGLSTSWYKLPLDSTLSLRTSYSSMTDTVAIPATDTAYGSYATQPNSYPYQENRALVKDGDTYNGDLRYGSAGVALVSAPIENLDTKLYYNFLRKWNKSNQITFFNTLGLIPRAGAAVIPNQTTGVFNYWKHNLGADVGYKLPLASKVGVGYEYMKVNRLREDAEETKDNTYYAQLQNSYLDFLSARLRYEYLKRTAHGNFDAFTGQDRFNRLFDVTDKTQNKIRAGVEVSPIEHVELGAEYAYSKSKYHNEDPIYGRNMDSGNEIYLDASYEMPKWFKLSAFGAREDAKVNITRRVTPTGGNYDPAAAPTTTNYNIYQRDSYLLTTYGLGVDVPVTEKMNFFVGWEQLKGDGSMGVAAQAGAGFFAGKGIEQIDDYLKTTVRAKTRYQFTDNLSATIAYMYEKLDTQDDQIEGYRRVAAGTRAYFTGAYTDNDYKAHWGVVTAEYRF